MLIIAMVVAATVTRSISLTALIGVAPLVAGIAVSADYGRETRRRPLEEISQAEYAVAASRS